jgi:sec-independent protein translocase protein TatB
MVPGLSLEHIVILGVIALVVVGPKDLPLLLRKLGMWTAKLRGMAQEFRTGFDELARQAELDELKKEVDALRRTTSISAIAPELRSAPGTLESYAGISPPPPPPVETPRSADSASSSMEEAPRSGGGGAPSVITDEPPEARTSQAVATPPQSSLSDDSSSIEEERNAPAAAAQSAP